MTSITPETDFNQEVTCTYKDKLYSVRDNGAVLRHPRTDGRLSSTDNRWTFGKLNNKTGYLEIASERVHRIVAMAFHGEPPTKEHVVDHIDTNRQNNRPENLRWVTRLENVLLNPITSKRIELVCGSVEAFLENPAKFRDLFPEPNYQWMCTVSKEEGLSSRKRLTEWANSDKSFSGGSIGKWVYYRGNALNEEKINEIFKQVEKKTGICRKALCSNKAMRGDYYDARIYAAKLLHSELYLSDYEIGNLMGLSATTVNLYLDVSADRFSGDYAEVREREFKKRFEMTPTNFIQKNWTTQSEFPCCPQEVHHNPIAEYAERLENNTIFFRNSYYITTVIQSATIDKDEALLVLYEIIREENRDKRWGIMKITFDSEKFVHEIVPNYNGTTEHYWLIDTENHFKSIVEDSEWIPLYDSQGREFKGDYMPL